MERCTTLTATCRCLSMRRILWQLSGFLVVNWSSMAMRRRRRSVVHSGAAGHSQTLCEALSGEWSSGLFCTCQEALGQQIDCGSLPTGPRLIGPGTDCARSRSGVGDFVQYLAQGDSGRASAAWKKKDLSNDAIASTKSERSIADVQAPLGRATTRSPN